LLPSPSTIEIGGVPAARGDRDRRCSLSRARAVLAWLVNEASGYRKGGDRDLVRVLIQGLASLIPHRLGNSHDEEAEWRQNLVALKPELGLAWLGLTLIIHDGLYHGLLHEPEKDKVFGDLVSWLDARCAAR
jgi:alpha-beta hydrolase superfamily lysophospholipase